MFRVERKSVLEPGSARLFSWKAWAASSGWAGLCVRISIRVSWLATQRQVPLNHPFNEALPINPSSRVRWSGCFFLDKRWIWSAGGLRLSPFVDLLLFTINKESPIYNGILFWCHRNITFINFQFYFGGYKLLQMCICSYKTIWLNLKCRSGHDGITIGSRQDFNFYYGFKRDEIERRIFFLI